MILQIFNNQVKFSKGYFKMLHDYNFDLDEQILFHYGKKISYFQDLGLKTYFLKSWFLPFGHFKLLYNMFKSDKIIVHCLASPFVLLLLLLFPKLNSKVYWVIWGKDLYFYHLSNKKNIFHKIYEIFRRNVFKKIETIVTIFEEEYLIAKKWYNVQGKNIECNILYPYCIDNSISPLDSDNRKSKFNILMGNSGSKTNRHIEAMQKLVKYKNTINKIYCPLSYGCNKKYRDKVTKEGNLLFGDIFIPLVDFIEFEEYKKLLKSIDIAIFNNNRQEALGNIYSLIFQAKTIYLCPNNATMDFFRRIGLQVFDYNNFDELKLLPQNLLEHNQQTLKKYINTDLSVKKWKEILYE